ncbi:TOM1-like protein 2 [Orchesella cincta]|uniref:TOM1-like protein 2 n=1 Tax=Orchesella cincta TaxID=48709 RepID=A0A1D2NAA3_ORCCI|nr:TOM1-like protein 2 [Orchesella cincta]
MDNLLAKAPSKDEIMSFFGGNPFSTPIGQKIEHATDAALASENWALNMEICDLVNSAEDGPKDSVRAIRKRLQQNAGKNYTVVMYTLTVLETLVKNCGKRFHILVCQKDFGQELVKLIGPKNDPPTIVQEKVLGLIQSWADTFRGQPELVGIVQLYEDLKSKGIEFPMTDLDSMVPILTPKRSVETEPILHPVNLGERHQPQQQPHQQQLQQEPPPPQQVQMYIFLCSVLILTYLLSSKVKDLNMISPPSTASSSTAETHGQSNNDVTAIKPPQVKVTPEQLVKIRRDLDIVQGNMAVFAEMLSEVKPGQEIPSGDMELLEELNTACKEMQRRIAELLCTVSSDELTAEMLHINDELNNLFLRYGRHKKNIEKTSGSGGSQPTGNKDEPSLIDFGGGDQSAANLASKIGALNVSGGNPSSGAIPKTTSHPKKEPDDFDMFAQSRGATYEKSKTSGSTYADNTNVDQKVGNLGDAARNKEPLEDEDILKTHRESDFDEMEAWLNANPPAGAVPSAAAAGTASLTSSEFDKFLAERAAAAASSPASGAGGSTKLDKR